MGYHAGMSRSSALILLGILIMLTPFSGLPSGFRDVLALIFGALVLGIGFFIRAKEIPKPENVVSPQREPAPSSLTGEPHAPDVLPEMHPIAETEPPHGVSPI